MRLSSRLPSDCHCLQYASAPPLFLLRRRVAVSDGCSFLYGDRGFFIKPYGSMATEDGQGSLSTRSRPKDPPKTCNDGICTSSITNGSTAK